MTEFMQSIISLADHFGYFGIVLLMAMESSIIPLPSEVVIPPFAYLASQGEMNIILIILCGTLGSLIGASVNYFVSLYLGRAVIYKLAETKLARWLFITPEKIKKAEDFFLRYGSSSTFIGRLLPVIRHLISIPAGFSKMDFKKFAFWTTVGSFIWVSVLAALGYFFGANRELLISHYHEISYAGIILGLGAIIYFIIKKKK